MVRRARFQNVKLNLQQQRERKNHFPHIPGKLRFFMFVISGLGGLIFGYDSTIIAVAMLPLRTDFALDTLSETFAVCSLLGGAMAGSLMGGVLADQFGRRRILLCAGGGLMLSSLATACAPVLIVFLCARLAVGYCVGVIACIVPVYVAEMVPLQWRGLLVTFNQVAATVGIILAYWSGLIIIQLNAGWRPMFLISSTLGILLFLIMLLGVETPRWLVSRNQWLQAHHALVRMRCLKTDEELKRLTTTLGGPSHGTIKELLRPGMRVALLVAVALACFQQCIGINTVFYYAPTIFRSVGFTSATDAIMASVLVAIVNTIAIVFAVWLIEHIGRRPMLMGGLASMVLMLCMMSGIFAFQPAQGGVMMLLVVLTYIASFSMSMGPLFWLLCTELFPNRLRALGASIGTFANWSGNLLVSISFLSLIDVVGRPLTFGFYAAMGGLALLFTWKMVPETRAKTSEQMEYYWLHNRRWPQDVS